MQNTNKIRAVLFDAYGTLLDVYSIGALAEQLFPTHGANLSVMWRDKQIEYTRLVTTCNDGAHYQPFSVLTRAALRYVCARMKLELSAEKEAALMAQYNKLTPFPENIAVLKALQSRGIPTGILSNGDASMLNDVVAHAGMDTLLDHVISVDPIRKFKTHPAAYALGETATGLSCGEILFVSSNAWDALAATWFGYQTLWVNRQGLPFEALGTQPTYTGKDLNAVLEIIA